MSTDRKTAVYVAAPWDERHGLAILAEQKIVAAGFDSTSRWIHYHGEEEPDPILLAREAIEDREDIRRADALLLINSQKRGHETSGKAVETGIAIELGIPVVVVGKWSNLFHFFPGVYLTDTVEEAIPILRKVTR